MLVSVIIPSYNHASYIAEAIHSVLDQDWPEIDLIVIDDGSCDESPALIRELLRDRKDSRFVLRENRGVIRTLNQGIEMACGDLVCLLSSDDYLLPGSLRIRAEYLGLHSDCIAVFAEGKCISETGETTGPLMKERTRRLFLVADPIREFMKGVSLGLHTMMVRTDVLREVGGFDTRFQTCEDLDIQVRLFLAGPVEFIDHAVRCYRRHQSSVSRTQNKRFCVDRILCCRKYLDEFPQLAPYRRLINRRLVRHYLALGRYLSRNGQGSKFEESLFQTGWPFAWRDLRLMCHLVQRRVLWASQVNKACSARCS